MMNKDLAQEILSRAIIEAYPILSCSAFEDEYKEAHEALEYLVQKGKFDND